MLIIANRRGVKEVLTRAVESYRRYGLPIDDFVKYVVILAYAIEVIDLNKKSKNYRTDLTLTTFVTKKLLQETNLNDKELKHILVDIGDCAQHLRDVVPQISKDYDLKNIKVASSVKRGLIYAY